MLQISMILSSLSVHFSRRQERGFSAQHFCQPRPNFPEIDRFASNPGGKDKKGDKNLTAISSLILRLDILSPVSDRLSLSTEARDSLCLRRLCRDRLGEGLMRELNTRPWPSALPWDLRNGVSDLKFIFHSFLGSLLIPPSQF